MFGESVADTAAVVSAIAASATTVLAIGTVIVYFIQAHLMRRNLHTMGGQIDVMREQIEASREATKVIATFELNKFVQSEDIREARGALFSIKDKPFDKWDESDRAVASKVCASYDQMGRLIKGEYAPADYWVGQYPSIWRTYNIVRPFIEEQRAPGRMGPEYWTGYTWLYEQACRSGVVPDRSQAASPKVFAAAG